MAKRPTKRATQPKRRSGRFSTGLPPEVTADPGAPAPAPAPPEVSPEQANEILFKQIKVVRDAFFKLAQARAADRVRFGELGWDEGSNYINAEMNGLEQQLAACVPQQQQQQPATAEQGDG